MGRTQHFLSHGWNGFSGFSYGALTLLVLAALSFPVHARTTTTFGQNAVGAGCNNAEKAMDFDTIAQCNAGTGAGTMQTAPIILGTVTAPPYAAISCDANKAGMLQWTGTSFAGCNGTAWGTIGTTTSGNTTPDAFSFTNQTGVELNTTITSNTVTLANYAGSVTATCGTNCTAIARNGVWGGTSVVGFNAGDTLAIRMTSAATTNTAKNATVTVGTTTSGTWSVTTRTGTPDAITFTNQTGVYTAAPISSNAVTLSGFTGTLTAQCNTGCTAIARNGTWGSTTVTDFASGDTIAIKQTSSSSANTATTASVTVGSTTSSTWSVTTGADACAGITTVGTACPDGTVYAGITPDGNKKMMVTRCDAGMTWGGSSCDGDMLFLPWNNGSVDWVVTGYDGWSSGKTNTDGLATLFDVASPYRVAKYCYDLVANGHSDWYLPAAGELWEMVPNATALNFIQGHLYWSSAEGWGDQDSSAIVIAMVDGWDGLENKNVDHAFRCARTD